MPERSLISSCQEGTLSRSSTLPDDALSDCCPSNCIHNGAFFTCATYQGPCSSPPKEQCGSNARCVQCNCNKWWRYVVPTNDGSIFHRACNHPGTHDGIDTNPNAYNDIMNSETLSGCQGYAINYLNSANGHYLGGSNYFNYCIGGSGSCFTQDCSGQCDADY